MKGWEFSFDLNCRAMFVVTQAFVPAMLDNGGGSIVNMAWSSARKMGTVNRCAYGASKGAVIGFTKSGRGGLHRPGHPVQRDLPGDRADSVAGRPHQRHRRPGAGPQDFVARQKMGRIATKEEVADLVIFLASDESSYITGQPMVIDGGMHPRP